MPEGHDQVNYLVIGKEFPDSIRGKDHELIIVVNEKLLNLYTNTKTLSSSIWYAGSSALPTKD